MIKTTIAILLTLFSVPAFAEPSVIPESSHILEIRNINLDELISTLNSEVDRINENNSWEDVDGLTNSGVEIILSAIHPINIGDASEEEIGKYVSNSFALIDGMNAYIQVISKEKVNRQAFFKAATMYMQNMMIMD
ncbi:MAG: hypothetical protein PHQ95_00830 [Candidatus Gracilibacteria bacterium]|nr:hypothetical protein [Candidatus Gracilibacteria bacterium]